MWPWEHLAVGYVLFSLTVRIRYRRPPTDRGAVVLAFATQLPDLVDKPGGWVLGVLPSGVSLAHSVFVAIPVSLLVLVLARDRGVPVLGIAFAVGYLSHLLGDVLYPVLIGGRPGFSAILWPLVSPPTEDVASVMSVVSHLMDQYLTYLSSPAGLGYVLLEVVLLGLAFALWIGDGLPGTWHVAPRRGSSDALADGSDR